MASIESNTGKWDMPNITSVCSYLVYNAWYVQKESKIVEKNCTYLPVIKHKKNQIFAIYILKKQIKNVRNIVLCRFSASNFFLPSDKFPPVHCFLPVLLT